MATYEKTSVVDAPLDVVWAFHSRASSLVAVTPAFLRLRVESVTGPDATTDHGVLAAGAEIRLSVAPPGLPRQRTTSVVLERERDDGRAVLVDEMREGPLPVWRHAHRFLARGDRTVVRDSVRYELPGGGLGRVASPLAVVGLEPLFAYRHRRTRQLLETT